ncbi:helix-turn-helix transcriptional regulator [Halovulum sp. GXIMD14793]
MSRRADRLFRLVAELRGRRLAVTGQALAEALEVSLRTVYRDIADLMASGVPISGEAGIGYRLDPGFELPPVMFTRDEVQALIVGGQMVQAFTDPVLAAAAQGAEAKIRAILDDEALRMLETQPYSVPVLPEGNQQRQRHGVIRIAIETRTKLRLDYIDKKGTPTLRTVWPLGIFGWTECWTLLAWCEKRDDFRNFRFDQARDLMPLDEVYPTREDRSVAHYIKHNVEC